jgi:hypothetical protein
MRKYIGIDIGKKGAIAIMEGDKITTHKIPMIKTEVDFHALHRMFENYEGFNGMVVFEKLGVIFGSSKKTAFSMGQQIGAIEMLCISLSMPYTKVPAKTWQAEMFQGVEVIKKSGSKTARDTKAMALVAIKRLFPNVKLTFGEVATVPHDGLIDAVLMAEYAQRKFK